MKCKARVFLKETRRGKIKVDFVAQIADWGKEKIDWAIENYSIGSMTFADMMKISEVCGGELVAEVKAVDEPTWGDHYAELSVVFKCKRCGCDVHPYLPDRYTVDEWLTKIVANLPD